jgi:endonuclease YncB( thermonuclease family)
MILIRLNSPRFPVAVIFLLTAATGDLFGAEIVEGPVLAQVERVVDGDTFAVKALIWPGQDIRVFVRVNGIDTPELRGKCLYEKKLAQNARRFVVNWTQSGWVKLKNIRRGKYAGRIIADVFGNNGRNLAQGLLKSGLAYTYSGGKKINWCGQDLSLTIPRDYSQ